MWWRLRFSSFKTTTIMEVIRVVKDKNYTTINNTIFKDQRVSCKSKGVFATIMSLPSDWDFSISGLSVILKEGKSAIYSAIEELENNGYVERERVRNKDGKIFGVSYKFYEMPINSDFNPHPENPDVDNPDVDNPDVDNQPQLSTNKINNLKIKDIYGGLSDTPLESVVKKSKNHVIDFDALLVFFNKTTGKNIRIINPKTKSQFLARLKEGYTKEDIMKAIVNCSRDKYHIDNPKYLTPEFISRADKIEKYANATTKQVTLPTDWFSRELTKEQINLLTDKQRKSWEHNKSVIAIEGGYLKPIEK